MSIHSWKLPRIADEYTCHFNFSRIWNFTLVLLPIIAFFSHFSVENVAITRTTCRIMVTLTRSDMTVAVTVAGYCLLLSGILRLTIPIAPTRVKREMWRMPRQIPHVRLSSLQHLLPSPPPVFLVYLWTTPWHSPSW